MAQKLYTESQVIDAISKAFRYNSNVEILKSLKPIELPSDEEIKNTATHLEPNVTRRAFQSGAKWMRDKIQGGDK